MKAREILQLLIPPILVMGLRKLRVKYAEPEWEYVPEAWVAAQAVKGWNVPSVLQAYASRWPEFMASLQGPQPSGGGVSATLSSHNTVVSFGYAVTLASIDKPRIAILDWGGNWPLLPDQSCSSSS